MHTLPQKSRNNRNKVVWYQTDFEKISRTEDPYEALAWAILHRACVDYYYSLIRHKKDREKEVMAFFHSEWCEFILPNIDLDLIIAKVQKEVVKYRERNPGQMDL